MYFRVFLQNYRKVAFFLKPVLAENSHGGNSISSALLYLEKSSYFIFFYYRYLATGNSFVTLHYQYLLGASTIRKIVSEICRALWECLKESYIPAPTRESWMEIAKDFYGRTDFPNCLGAVDGKHIRIQMPPKSGSDYYNYKQYFSVILLAVVDSDYCFTYVDIGAYGKSSDSNVFQSSTFGKRLSEDRINIPNSQQLPHDEHGKFMPFVFVGDEAFAASTHILRPYSNRYLDAKKRIFNYRLSRARRMVECTFGILASKWRIFYRSLDVNLKHSTEIIKAACILHNFVRKRDGVRFEDTLYTAPFENISQQGARGTNSGLQVRDYFANYFTSPQGSVHWQYDKV